jgi:hypothetical protein
LMPTTPTISIPPMLCKEYAGWNAFDIVRSTLTEGSADAQRGEKEKSVGRRLRIAPHRWL